MAKMDKLNEQKNNNDPKKKVLGQLFKEFFKDKEEELKEQQE